MPFASIPWRKYSEVEVQEIIIRCFESAGYTTKNIHKSDPAGEKGVDILVELDGRKTAIAVKIKPRGVDRAQLQDLSEYPSEHRVYVHLSTPTHEFIRYMQRKDIKSNVQFWSSEDLGLHLFDLDPFLMSELSLSYSEFCFRCISIALNLIQLWDEAAKLEEQEHDTLANSVDSSILKTHTLWEAKDHSAALNKSMWTLKVLFEHLRDLEFTNEQQIAILRAIQDVLTDSCKIILDRLEWVVTDLIKRFKPNLLRVVSSTRYRTSWKYISEFLKNMSAFFPKRVLESLSELRDSKLLWKGMKDDYLDEIIDFTGRLDDIRSSFSPGLAGIKFFIGQISLFSWGLEEIINDLYLSVADRGFDGYFRDWMNDPAGTWDGPAFRGLPSNVTLPHERLGRNASHILNPDMLILEETVKTRWHLITGSKDYTCPECGSKLMTIPDGGRIKIKCMKCEYEFR